MNRLALTIATLTPSVALAHPGHDDVGIGGTPIAHALITNPAFVLGLVVAAALVASLVTRRVLK